MPELTASETGTLAAAHQPYMYMRFAQLHVVRTHCSERQWTATGSRTPVWHLHAVHAATCCTTHALLPVQASAYASCLQARQLPATASSTTLAVVHLDVIFYAATCGAYALLRAALDCNLAAPNQSGICIRFKQLHAVRTPFCDTVSASVRPLRLAAAHQSYI